MAIPRRNEETTKNSVNVANVLAETQAECLQNTSLEHYCYINMHDLYCIVSVVLAPVLAWMGCVLLSIMLVLY
jgi:hypothetical protein